LAAAGEEALFDEEFSEEEVLGELAPLTVLLAFLLLSSGRAAAALDKLQPLVAGDIHARDIAALAANNWAVASYLTGRGTVPVCAEEGTSVPGTR
jgi:hypothetical protein